MNPEAQPMPSPWIDISRPIHNGIPQWPGDPELTMEPLCEIGPDSPAKITKLSWLSHFLTHVDAPSHFIPNGKNIDDLPLSLWSGRALVVEVKGDVIDIDDVPAECDGLCVLFKTRNGELWNKFEFDPNYVYISESAAEALAHRSAKLVGIDYLSVEKFDDKAFPAHRAILGAGIPILEGIDLRLVEPGDYELVAFPLLIVGCDGSPVRAALRKA